MLRTVSTTSGGHRLRILHLSDLHLRGPRETERERRTRVLGTNWIANLAELRQEGEFDLVAFTGDVAFGGALDEYLELMWRPREDGTVAAWLDETLAAVGCTRAQIYIVPGNHDIDRSVYPGAWRTIRDTWLSAGADDDAAFARWIVQDRAAPRGIDPALRGQILARQSAYRAWLAHGLGRTDLLPDPQRSHLGYRITIPAGQLPFPVHIIGLDSAWLAGDDNDARKLRLTDDQLLRLCTNSDGEHLAGLRLALTHHPLADLADGERARRLLQEHGIDLLLSGHLHEPEAREIATPDGQLRDLATGCLYQNDRYRNAVTALTLNLDDAGHIHEIEFRFRGWSDRGYWHDDNSLYKGTRDGRLLWPPRTSALFGAPSSQVGPAGRGNQAFASEITTAMSRDALRHEIEQAARSAAIHRRNRFTRLFAVVKAAELLLDHAYEAGGLLSFRIEVESRRLFDDLVETRTTDIGSTELHGWHIKQQATDLSRSDIVELLVAASSQTDLAGAHFVVAESVVVSGVGPLRVLRDLCHRLGRDGAVPDDVVAGATEDERCWLALAVNTIGDGCGSFGTAQTESNSDRLDADLGSVEHVAVGRPSRPSAADSRRETLRRERPLCRWRWHSTIYSCRLDAPAAATSRSTQRESHDCPPS